METKHNSVSFSEAYGHLRSFRAAVREGTAAVSESVVQCIWYDQLFSEEGLATDQGKPIRVISPGWWNHEAGPDFKGAQIEFGDELRTGDVEIHLDHGAWKQHGHDADDRYNDVVLVVTLETTPPRTPPATMSGRRLPTLLLGRYLDRDVHDIAEGLLIDEYPYAAARTYGQCSALVQDRGVQSVERFLRLAGEWRMLNKARAIRERMDRAGADQAIYEGLLAACGFSHFKHHFLAVARQLPYDRARQLARQDALLLEAALLQIAGLLPDALPEGTSAVPHFARLRALRRDRLGGLKSLPLSWRRVNVRPTNNPERRLAGAARFLARTAGDGLATTLESVWRQDLDFVARRRAFEALFPNPVGFWASHCTWAGKKMDPPVALLGNSRVRSIIGNVFIPATLATARRERDRALEERVFDFFARLPKEADNHVLKIMVPHVFGEGPEPRLNFRMQQGLLQMHQDWCESNPSCRDCALIQYLEKQ
jgi:hypothetical protein